MDRANSGVYISPEEGRVDTQRASISGQVAVMRASRLNMQKERPEWAQGLLKHLPPETMTIVPVIEVLDDGSVKVTLGNLYGFVSSMHLVDTKVNQMLHSEQLETQL